MSVCILALLAWQAECIFSMQHCFIKYGLSGCTKFYQISHKWHDFQKNVLDTK